MIFCYWTIFSSKDNNITYLKGIRTSLVAQKVKCLSTMWETRVRSLCREDTLEKEMATHSNTIAWKIPWMEEPDRLQSMGSQRIGHDWATSLSLSLKGILWGLNDKIKVWMAYKAGLYGAVSPGQEGQIVVYIHGGTKVWLVTKDFHTMLKLKMAPVTMSISITQILIFNTNL